MKANVIAAAAALLAGANASPTSLEQRQGGSAAVCFPASATNSRRKEEWGFADFVFSPEMAHSAQWYVPQPKTQNPNPNPLAPEDRKSPTNLQYHRLSQQTPPWPTTPSTSRPPTRAPPSSPSWSGATAAARATGPPTPSSSAPSRPTATSPSPRERRAAGPARRRP